MGALEGQPDAGELLRDRHHRGRVLAGSAGQVLHRLTAREELGLRLQGGRRGGQQDEPAGEAQQRQRQNPGKVQQEERRNAPEVRLRQLLLISFIAAHHYNAQLKTITPVSSSPPPPPSPCTPAPSTPARACCLR